MTLSEPRELTEIENRIVQRIATMILDSLRRAWEQLIDFHLSIVNQGKRSAYRTDCGGQRDGDSGGGMRCISGETVGTMNMCIPLLVLNPVLDQISQQTHFTRRMSDALASSHAWCYPECHLSRAGGGGRRTGPGPVDVEGGGQASSGRCGAVGFGSNGDHRCGGREAADVSCSSRPQRRTECGAATTCRSKRRGAVNERSGLTCCC